MFGGNLTGRGLDSIAIVLYVIEDFGVMAIEQSISPGGGGKDFRDGGHWFDNSSPFVFLWLEEGTCSLSSEESKASLASM